MTSGLLKRPSHFINRTEKAPTTSLDDSIDIFAELFKALEICSEASQPSKARTVSHLLALPAELRSAIYAAVLLDPDVDLCLLQTCRQIYMESSAALYQRPVLFSSQTKLFAWIDRSEDAALKRVRTLTLRLTDVDLSSLFSLSPSKRNARTSAWNLYQQELEALDKALQCLPGLVDLTVVPPEKHNSQLLKGMYLAFLRMVPQRCQNLRHLMVHDSDAIMEKVPALKQVAQVTFDARKDEKKSESSKSRDRPIKMEADDD